MPFIQVKKSINKWEVTLICLIFTFLLTYLILGCTVSVVIYSKKWITKDEEITRLTDDKVCNIFLNIQDVKGYFNVLFSIILFIWQIVIYQRLRKIMKTRLFYFYTLTKNRILALYISGATFYLLDSIYHSIFQFLKDNDFNSTFDNYVNVKWKFFIDFFLNIIRPVILALYWYFSTKSIDFVLYVRAWMFGYRILEEFDNMSYFISHSCIYRPDRYETMDNSELDLKNEFFLGETRTTVQHEIIDSFIYTQENMAILSDNSS